MGGTSRFLVRNEVFSKNPDEELWSSCLCWDVDNVAVCRRGSSLHDNTNAFVEVDWCLQTTQ